MRDFLQDFGFFSEYTTLHKEVTVSHSLKEREVQTLFERYEELYLSLRSEVEELERLKKEIKSYVLEAGETISHGRVKATYKRGYTRTYWDGSGLKGYAVAHPEINNFRKDREYGPSVSVSVKGGKGGIKRSGSLNR